MPRADNTESISQINLARLLLIGDGKCGKSHLSGMAAKDGFNLLYFDADVASQTLATLPIEARKRIYILNCGDTMSDGKLDFRFVELFKRFTTKSKFVWNDTKSREYSVLDDGDSTEDEVWEIFPAKLDPSTVLVVDSWTSLSQSAMNWAAKEYGVDLQDLTAQADRASMRSVYQAAGEKLTQYLIMIRSMPCHVIVIAHPSEFVKTERPVNQTVKQIKEGDLKVLWTKMVPKSVSNNHSMMMAKYFTDIAWLEVDAFGDYKIDYRPSQERISGSHLKEIGKSDILSFSHLVKHIGGAIPDGNQSVEHWIQIHQGYEADSAKKKSSLVLGAGAGPVAEVKMNAPVKAGLSLSNLGSK